MYLLILIFSSCVIVTTLFLEAWQIAFLSFKKKEFLNLLIADIVICEWGADQL